MSTAAVEISHLGAQQVSTGVFCVLDRIANIASSARCSLLRFVVNYYDISTHALT